VFFRLRELGPGDLVSVGFTDGSRSTFRVVARRSFPKSALPAMLFERDGRPVLTLVTCGGAFDETTRSYSDNVVVFAVPSA
jgi:Sortase domain